MSVKKRDLDWAVWGSWFVGSAMDSHVSVRDEMALWLGFCRVGSFQVEGIVQGIREQTLG